MKRACVQIGSKGWTQGKKPLVLSATGRYSQRHNQPATEKRPRQSQHYSQPGIKTCHVQLDLADVPASLAGDSTLAVLQLEALHKGKSLQPTTYPFALAPAHMSSLQGSVSYASTCLLVSYHTFQGPHIIQGRHKLLVLNTQTLDQPGF